MAAVHQQNATAHRHRAGGTVNPCTIIAIDSGGASGWALLHRGVMLGHGVANTLSQRHQVALLALAAAEERRSPLVAVLEEHTRVPLAHGTRARGGPVKRNTATILGMGANRGRWLEHLELHGVRCVGVSPNVWRPAVLGIRGTTRTDAAKRAAVQWVRGQFRFEATHDEAEACAIGWWGTFATEVGELAAMRKKARLIA